MKYAADFSKTVTSRDHNKYVMLAHVETLRSCKLTQTGKQLRIEKGKIGLKQVNLQLLRCAVLFSSDFALNSHCCVQKLTEANLPSAEIAQRTLYSLMRSLINKGYLVQEEKDTPM